MLPKAVAELIAAGEVVERPASVVKELAENCADAGATRVTVEIQSGGIRYIRLTDNGCGIRRDDIRNAFVRHATSKVRDAADLDMILTYGFRGEALASVAAVAQVEVLTRAAEENIGTAYVIKGGEEISLSDAGCPQGTTIIVRNLFSLTPARLKFLKKDSTEGAAVAQVLERAALAAPGIAFTFIRDGKEIFRTPGDGNLQSVIRALFDKAFCLSLYAVRADCGGVHCEGFVSLPENCFPHRRRQYFFLNGRPVNLPAASAALTEAFKTHIPHGKHPACFLNITVPPDKVDVNVHPAKTEVRFADERPVFQAVYQAAAPGRGYLAGNVYNPNPSPAPLVEGRGAYALHTPPPIWQPPNFDVPPMAHEDAPFLTAAPMETPMLLRSAGYVPPDSQWEATTDTYSEESSRPLQTTQQIFPPGGTLSASVSPPMQKVIPPPADEQELIRRLEEIPADPKDEPVPEQTSFLPESAKRKVIGELFGTYIQVELGDKQILIDKHAAHERIIYNRLKKQTAYIDRQMLLLPLTVQLPPEECNVLLDNSELLEKAGYDISAFGENTVALREVPMVLAGADFEGILTELAGELLAHKDHVTAHVFDLLLFRTACRAAVKANDFTSESEMEAFAELVLGNPEVQSCPHGRPVTITMTKQELERRFLRLG
ncbi:MAG: DNA mismatch repair endonuclease MutL [Oscillospiraceae bacterium]|nr:DNA mismatch repair endonuclease MutL [Oscillospiraceae bacterium]